ncbi:MAG TPA: FkbM family methyltransferase [Pirellulaceae bacterium]|nr:FkbM family methyltransferase [Pirellulaceae bacterium]
MLKFFKHQLRQFRLRKAGVLDDPGARPLKLGNWPLLSDSIDEDSVVYSFGVGDNITWDRAMIARFGATVHAFDPTPQSIAWVARQKLPPQFRFHDCGISNHDGVVSFYPPRKAGGMHYSQESRHRSGAAPKPILGKVERLTTIMQRLGHEQIDVLKLDVEGSEFDAVPDVLASEVPVGQLLVEIHYHFPSRSLAAGLALIAQIKAAGMECFYISERGLEFGFVSRRMRESRKAA